MEKRTWEELLSDGLIAREGGDKSNWLVGDLAIQVEHDYGTDAVVQFAKDIILPKAKVQRFIRVAKAYPEETRHPFLTFEHHNEVYTREDRHSLLDKAENEQMTIEAFRMMLKNMRDSIPADKRTVSMTFQEEELQTIVKWAFAFPNRESADEVLLQRIQDKYDRITLNAPKIAGVVEQK